MIVQSTNPKRLAGVTPTAAGLALLGAEDAAAQRTSLGLGSLATQNAGNVAITGGSVTGLSALGMSGNITDFFAQITTANNSDYAGLEFGWANSPTAELKARESGGAVILRSKRGGATSHLQFHTSTGEKWRIADAGARLHSNASLSWGLATPDINPDLFLHRDAANTLAQRNGTSPQAFRLYNTFTDGSNYERVSLRWNSNTLQLLSDVAGTGVVPPIEISAGGQVLTVQPVSSDGFRMRFGSGQAYLSMVSNPSSTGGFRFRRNTTDEIVGRFDVSNPAGTMRLGCESELYQFWHAGSIALHPALKRVGTALHVRIADDSDFAPLAAKQFVADGPMLLTDLATNHKIGVISGILSISTTGHLVLSAGGVVAIADLPTSDPEIQDALWNDSGTLKISAG